MKISQVYQQNPNCLLEDMDGELLLYNPESAVTLQLNGSSAIVWRLCDGERSVGDIINLVKESYPQQADQIADDVSKATDLLSERNALMLVEEPQ